MGQNQSGSKSLKSQGAAYSSTGYSSASGATGPMMRSKRTGGGVTNGAGAGGRIDKRAYRKAREGVSAAAETPWTFVRGNPPLELLKLPTQAPKRFSTRSTAGTPDASAATNVFPCFRGGLLFRIIDPHDNGWWFYNDTADMEIHIEYHFGPDSHLDVPHEHVTVEPSTLPGTEGQWICASMIVFPGETLLFTTGTSKVNGFKSVYRIAPLSEQVAQRRAAEIQAVVAKMCNEMEVVAKLTADLGGGGGNNTRLIEDDIVERCSRQQVPFVDLNFPPTIESMYGATVSAHLLNNINNNNQSNSGNGKDNSNFGSNSQQLGSSGSYSQENTNNNINTAPSSPMSPSTTNNNNNNKNSSPLLGANSSVTEHPAALFVNDGIITETTSIKKQQQQQDASSPGGISNPLSSISPIAASVAGGSKFVSEFGISDTQLTAQLDSDARDLHRRLPPVVWMRPRQYLLSGSEGVLTSDKNTNNLNNNRNNQQKNSNNNKHVKRKYNNNNNNMKSNNNNNDSDSDLDDGFDDFELSDLASLEAATDSTVSCLSRGIDITDVEIGFLGDTWLQSALATLAEHPEVIRWIFRHSTPLRVIGGGIDENIAPPNDNNNNNNPNNNNKNKNGNNTSEITVFKTPSQMVGSYTTCLNVAGWWISIVLDDYIPCIGNKPAFASSRRDRRELWPALIQKSFAKIYGSYACLSAGDPLSAMRIMTGCPTYRFDDEWQEAAQETMQTGKEPDELLVGFLMKMLVEECFLVSLNTRGVDISFSHDLSESNQLHCQEIVNRYESIGLSMGHAYNVVDMKYFPQWKLFMLKIRNPWMDLQQNTSNNNNDGKNNSNNNKNNSNNTSSAKFKSSSGSGSSNNIISDAATTSVSGGGGGSWNGNWSWQSEMWDRFSEVAKECQPSQCRLEGDNFWISWEDAIQYFDGGGICFYRDKKRPWQKIRSAHEAALEEQQQQRQQQLEDSNGVGPSATPAADSSATFHHHHHHQTNNNKQAASTSSSTTLLQPVVKHHFDHRVLGQFIDSLCSVCLEVVVKGDKPQRLTFMVSQSDCIGARAEPLAAMMLSIAAAVVTEPSSKSNKNMKEQGTTTTTQTYSVNWNSTTDPLNPSSVFTYTLARDLAIIVELPPSDHPYLVIPRVFDAGVNKRYVLGVLSDTNMSSISTSSNSNSSIDDKDFYSVKFVQINGDSPFFLNRKLVSHKSYYYSPSLPSSSSSTKQTTLSVSNVNMNTSTTQQLQQQCSSSSSSSSSKPVKARYQVKLMNNDPNYCALNPQYRYDGTEGDSLGIVHESFGKDFRI